MRNGQKLYFATFCQGDVDQKCFVKFPTKITDFSDIEPKGRTTCIYIKYSFPNRCITL